MPWTHETPSGERRETLAVQIIYRDEAIGYVTPDDVAAMLCGDLLPDDLAALARLMPEPPPGAAIRSTPWICKWEDPTP